MANARHVTSPGGILQILHLVFGAVAIGCGAASYESQVFKERFFLWSVVAILIVSFILLVVSIITANAAVKTISSAMHVIGGILLLVAGTLMILSVKYIEDDLCTPRPWGGDCNFNKTKKLVAASFAIINGVLYLIASVLLVLVKNDDDSGYIEAERTFARPSKQ